jgi:DNA-binding transcriptional regulator YiaG
MKIKFPTYEIELSVEELKELSTDSSIIKSLPVPVDSSNKPSEKPSIEPLKLRNVKRKMPLNNRKLSLDTIKQIKDLESKNWTNINIAKKLNISSQLVNYWRKNTPKDING